MSSSTRSAYGYQPSLGVGITGLVLFVLSTIVHGYQVWTSRMWWLVVLVIGGITEIIGYAARIYSWHDDTSLDAFLAQTVTLIIAPSFFSAALYVVFGQIIIIVGRQYSCIPPLVYTVVFVIADLISLIIQAIGGGQAATAARTNSDTTLGTHIMIAGICWQMLSMLVYVVLVLIYVIRVGMAKAEIPKNIKIFILGMGLVTLMIFIRCIYRTVELQAGWTGYIITHEVFFACLDGLPMIIALVAFNIFHPGRYIKNDKKINEMPLNPQMKNI
ncbi:unnamed protein product [Adineta steineri]|uniref:RTA1-like protein n=1 Tax=Adineta steineri TaxID=433720 RepID=A0A814VMI4_9BILA|nr:unnamed protein product [Adineta steineri]CAF1436201.1 unnamed protein product [Adineta steineri]